MDGRYFLSAAQAKIIIASVQHGDIKTFIKTMKHVLAHQYLGVVENPRTQKVEIVEAGSNG